MKIRNLTEIVAAALEAGASDVHIVCGIPVRVRVDGSMTDLFSDVLTREDCEAYAREAAGNAYESIALIGELDMAKTFPGNVRTRLNIYRQQGSVSIALRILQGVILTPEELHLPPVVGTFASYRTGLVLVTGETGSGKSTTLAALINEINHNRAAHIITLEKPIEYIYKPDKCVINQREIGTDTRSYTDALRSVLREDPDIILIGEMNDRDTMEAALNAAETGHLVFATLHTNTAAESIDRILGMFSSEQQNQFRVMLAGTLRAVVTQQLLPKRYEKGRIAACEVMVVNSAIRHLIRDNKVAQIEDYISLGSKDGCISMDASILQLVSEGEVSRDVAASYARRRENMNKF